MAKAPNQLTNEFVSSVTAKGMYSDGLGLYLQVSTWGTKAWLFKFSLNGKTRAKGLGSIHKLTIDEVRAEAAKLRQMVANGIDPIEQAKNSYDIETELDSLGLHLMEIELLCEGLSELKLTPQQMFVEGIKRYRDMLLK